MYFCVNGCSQLIGCFLCASKIEDCPSGLDGILGIPDISVTSTLWEAKIDVQDQEDADNEML